MLKYPRIKFVTKLWKSLIVSKTSDSNLYYKFTAHVLSFTS